jgi:hypothetical protein
VLDRVYFTSPPDGKRHDLDPEGHWRTVQGQHIHITGSGEIDAGGHPELRKALEEKAGLKAAPPKPPRAAKARPGRAAGAPPLGSPDGLLDRAPRPTPRSDALAAEVAAAVAAGNPLSGAAYTAAVLRLHALSTPELMAVHAAGGHQLPAPAADTREGQVGMYEAKARGLAVEQILAAVTPPVAARMAADRTSARLVKAVAGSAAKARAARARARAAAEAAFADWHKVYNTAPPATDTEAFAAWKAANRDRLDAAEARYVAAAKASDAAWYDEREFVAKALAVRDPAAVEVRPEPDAGVYGAAARTETARAAAAWLGGITARAGGPAAPAAVAVRHTPARPHAKWVPGLSGGLPLGEIYLTGLSKSDAVHELGHQLEYHLPGAAAAARAFLHHRTDWDTPVPLAEKFPGRGYEPDEKGSKDHFGRHFGPDAAYYCGKHYASGSTEIVSMGVEALYNDPVAFCQKDPEFAAFVVGLLAGRLR